MRFPALVAIFFCACASSSKNDTKEPTSEGLVNAHNAFAVAACGCDDDAAAWRRMSSCGQRISGAAPKEPD